MDLFNGEPMYGPWRTAGKIIQNARISVHVTLRDCCQYTGIRSAILINRIERGITVCTAEQWGRLVNVIPGLGLF